MKATWVFLFLGLAATGCTDADADQPVFESFSFERNSELLTVDVTSTATWRHKGQSLRATLPKPTLTAFASFLTSQEFLSALPERVGCLEGEPGPTTPLIEVVVAGRPAIRQRIGGCNESTWITLDYWIGVIQSEFSEVGSGYAGPAPAK